MPQKDTPAKTARRASPARAPARSQASAGTVREEALATPEASSRTAASAVARGTAKAVALARAKAPTRTAARPLLKTVAGTTTPKPRARRAATVVKKAAPEHALPIYQIYFSAQQSPALDASFIPLDNSASADPLHEFAVFERLAQDEGLRLAPLWGALSWRFGVKTGMSGDALRKAIADHPGQDLYYCNPYPEHEALFINSWQQGVPSHPAFMELCTAVFHAAGLDVGELAALHPSQRISTCNYFIGSPDFWSLYLPWVRGVLDRARTGLPASVLKTLDSNLSDPRSRHGGATYWPFIVERLLPLFLADTGKSLKTHKLALPVVDGRLNTHLQRLREMKDVAHRTRSRWMYACWLNYRNLYLLQTAGPDWCKQYLTLVSNTELDFR